MTSGNPRILLFARRPSVHESFATLELQRKLLETWAKGMGMDVLRSYQCSEDDYVKARDTIDAMVGYAIRTGVDAIVFCYRDMLDDDSLELLAEVSYTYGIDIWFICDDDEPWNEWDDRSDSDDDTVDDDDDRSGVDIFILISKGVL